MKPSLPIDLPAGTKFTHVAEPIECGALRLGRQCCNDAYFVLVCPQSLILTQFIGLCPACFSDIEEYTYQETGMTLIECFE